jgi:hypothetical protein
MNRKTTSTPLTATAEPLDIAPNQKAASASWNVPLAVLKAAKAAGCKAFSAGGRVNRKDFLEWLAANSKDAEQAVALDLAKADKQELEAEKIRAQIRLLNSRNERETRTVISLVEAQAEWARAASIFQEEVRQLMEPEHYRVAVTRAKTRIGEMFTEEPTARRK